MGSLIVIPLGILALGYTILVCIMVLLTVIFSTLRLVKKRFTKTCMLCWCITLLLGFGEYVVVHEVTHYEEIEHQKRIQEEGKELVAIQDNDQEVVRKYLENGWNPNESTKSIYYAIAYAPKESKDNDQWEMLELLLQYGAKPDVQIEEYPKGVNSPLTYTTECGYYGATKLLLAYGASPNYQENYSLKNGLLALRFYENPQAKEILELLIQAGTDLEIADKNGETGREMLANFEKDYEQVKDKVPQYDEIVQILDNRLKD